MTKYSVLVPAYNAESTIEKTLESIARQTHPISEVVLINDGSRDRTGAIVESWKTRLPLVIINHPKNMGLIPTLIDGAAACSNEWILRLDTDDYWAPNHVAVIDEMRRNSDAILFSTRVQFVDMQGTNIRITPAPHSKRIRADLMFGNPVVHSAVAFSKRAYLKVGGYRPEVETEDFDLWIRLLNIGNYQSADTVTVTYLYRPDSVSRSNIRARKLGDIACFKLAISLFWKRHPVYALRGILNLAGKYAELMVRPID